MKKAFYKRKSWWISLLFVVWLLLTLYFVSWMQEAIESEEVTETDTQNIKQVIFHHLKGGKDDKKGKVNQNSDKNKDNSKTSVDQPSPNSFHL